TGHKEADEGKRERDAVPLKAPTLIVQSLKPDSVATAKAAIPPLTKALRDSDTHVRIAAASALGETGPLAKQAVSDLSDILRKDPDDDARLQACLTLGNI